MNAFQNWKLNQFSHDSMRFLEISDFGFEFESQLNLP